MECVPPLPYGIVYAVRPLKGKRNWPFRLPESTSTARRRRALFVLQVRMELATEIVLCFSSPLCCQKPWLCRMAVGKSRAKWAANFTTMMKTVSMAIFCHRGQILQSRFVSFFPLLAVSIAAHFWVALCVVRTFLDAGRQVDEAGWRGLTGTWHVQVLSSMYSRASEQMLQNARGIYKNAPFCFMYTLPMFSRWRSDCYGYFLPYRRDLCRTTYCFTLSASCHQLASHVQLLWEASLTETMRRMLWGCLTGSCRHRGVVFNHSHCCCGTLLCGIF